MKQFYINAVRNSCGRLQMKVLVSAAIAKCISDVDYEEICMEVGRQ